MSELTGVIHIIYETQAVSNSFSKREFILKTQDNPQYEQYIKLEFTQDKCSLLDNYQPGQKVKVAYNLRGREWTNKQGETVYFNTIQAWKIEAIAQISQEQAYYDPTEKPVSAKAEPVSIDENDLPF